MHSQSRGMHTVDPMTDPESVHSILSILRHQIDDKLTWRILIRVGVKSCWSLTMEYCATSSSYAYCIHNKRHSHYITKYFQSMHTDAKIGYEDRQLVSADSNAVYVHMFFTILCIRRYPTVSALVITIMRTQEDPYINKLWNGQQIWLNKFWFWR